MRLSSPDRRFTVRDENVGPVGPEFDDSTSVEATLSETSNAERLISSSTVCRIMASIMVLQNGRLKDNVHNT